MNNNRTVSSRLSSILPHRGNLNAAETEDQNDPPPYTNPTTSTSLYPSQSDGPLPRDTRVVLICLETKKNPSKTPTVQASLRPLDENSIVLTHDEYHSAPNSLYSLVEAADKMRLSILKSVTSSVRKTRFTSMIHGGSSKTWYDIAEEEDLVGKARDKYLQSNSGSSLDDVEAVLIDEVQWELLYTPGATHVSLKISRANGKLHAETVYDAKAEPQVEGRC